MTETSDEHAPVFDMKSARAKFRSVVDTSRKGRKARHKTVSDSADGRSLRETGRTEQFNFKATPGLHKRAKEAAAHKGVRLAEWMERVINAALDAEGGGDA